ncbi:hypothetical protein, partial [Halorubrum sp. SD626R]|uniref:hypothetical protein n=1 Tax=Halorubrum sp. SD626R TaxID=1419722 RepID=UPI001A7EDE4F
FEVRELAVEVDDDDSGHALDCGLAHKNGSERDTVSWVFPAEKRRVDPELWINPSRTAVARRSQTERIAGIGLSTRT